MDTSLNPVDTLKSVAVPLMRPVKFAELSGLSESVVRKMINDGTLPTIALGKGERPTRLINLVALHDLCALKASVWEEIVACGEQSPQIRIAGS